VRQLALEELSGFVRLRTPEARHLGSGDHVRPPVGERDPGGHGPPITEIVYVDGEVGRSRCTVLCPMVRLTVAHERLLAIELCAVRVEMGAIGPAPLEACLRVVFHPDLAFVGVERKDKSVVDEGRKLGTLLGKELVAGAGVTLEDERGGSGA